MASEHPNLIGFYIGPARNYAAPSDISIYRIGQLYSAWLWKKTRTRRFNARAWHESAAP
jgi:hypothetical protein